MLKIHLPALVLILALAASAVAPSMFAPSLFAQSGTSGAPVAAPVVAPAAPPAPPAAVPVPAVVPAAPAAIDPVVAPPAPPAPPLPGSGIVSELQLLSTQVGNVNNAVTDVTANVKPVTESLKKLISIGESYPQQVQEYKATHGIPANATPAQELDGVGRALLEKAGFDPKTASAASKQIQAASETAKAFKPLAPSSIMLSVGITAGMSVLGQLTSTGKVDLAKSVSFLGDKGFWGGLIGSGVSYSLAALAITKFLPVGFGGPVAAFLPTFGALTASFLGGELGANALHSGNLKDALKNLSIADIVAQGAGSTIGMFVGANLFTSMAAGMGSFAGPLGSIIGGMVGASLAKWAVHTVKNMITGGSASLSSAGATDPTTSASMTVNPNLPAATLMPAASIKQIQDDYRAAYASYIEAEQVGNKAAQAAQFAKLQTMRQQYELGVRTLMSSMATPGHQPAPAH